MIFDKKVSRDKITLDSLNSGRKYYFVHMNNLDEKRMDGVLSYSILESRDIDSTYCEYLVECEFTDGELTLYSKNKSNEIEQSDNDFGGMKFFERYYMLDIKDEDEIFEECKYDSFENCSFGIENLNVNEEKVSQNLRIFSFLDESFLDEDGNFSEEMFQAYLNQQISTDINRVVVTTINCETSVYGIRIEDYRIYSRSQTKSNVWKNKVIHVEYNGRYNEPSFYRVETASEMETTDIAKDIVNAEYPICNGGFCRLL